MKLITKVVALEATKLLLTVIIVVFGIYGLRGIGDNLRAISHSDIPLMVSISKITAAQIEQSLWLQKVVLETEFGDAIAAEEASLKYGELSDQVTAEITQVVQFVKAILEKENNELDKNKFQQLLASLRKIESDYDNYTNIAIRLLVLIRQNDEAALKAQLPEAQILVESMSNDLQKLNASIARSTEIRALGAEQDESVATNTMIFVSLIALALALVLGIFIARNISKRFGCDPTKLERMAALVAEGRLEIERDAMAEGVYGAISRTVENLTKIIRGIKAGAKEVSAAAEQVFQGNLNLSQRTQEQASSLEQVAASMEQMIGTTNQNADNALQASKLADSAREIADKGKKIVDDTVAAMDIINDSSGQIANIIGVIEELAFQTNLLALNATVEAARAGESGRGFAVVAAEVKNLAGRSAKASNDITAVPLTETKKA
jgi:methyl-accepting chemotaxis protein